MSRLMIALFAAAGLGLAAPAMAQLHAPLAPASPISKDAYNAAKADADAQLKVDGNACASLTGNPKDLCVAEAKGRNEVAKADAEAAYENTPKAREAARVVRTDAYNNVTAERFKVDSSACASLAGNAKDICVAEAKGRSAVAKADAQAAYENTPKAREAARIVRAEAYYNVTIEKCDDLAGNRKDVCVAEAKAALVKGKADAKVDRVAADTNQDASAKQAAARKDANADKRDAEYKVAIEKCDSLAGPAKDGCVSSAKVQFGKS